MSIWEGSEQPIVPDIVDRRAREAFRTLGLLEVEEEKDDEVTLGSTGEYRAWYRNVNSNSGPPYFAPVNSRFGCARDSGNRPHKGIDIFAPKGSEIYSLTSGLAQTFAGSSTWGQIVWVQFRWKSTDFRVLYAHLDSAATGIDQVGPSWTKIKIGDLLGRSGLVGLAGCSGSAPEADPICDDQIDGFEYQSDHVHIELKEMKKTDLWNEKPFCDPAEFFKMRLKYAEENRRFDYDSEDKKWKLTKTVDLKPVTDCSPPGTSIGGCSSQSDIN